MFGTASSISVPYLFNRLASRFDLFHKSQLLRAVEKGDLTAVKKLVKKVGADIRETNGTILAENSTPLMIAAWYGHRDITDFLIKQGAKINARNGDSCTALMYAACWGHKDVVKLLIEARADLNKSRSYCGTTPLMFAAAHGHVEIVDLLLKAGADVHAKDHRGQTALNRVHEKKAFGYECAEPSGWDKIITTLNNASATPRSSTAQPYAYAS
jgi:ankyrin repeat protein